MDTSYAHFIESRLFMVQGLLKDPHHTRWSGGKPCGVVGLTLKEYQELQTERDALIQLLPEAEFCLNKGGPQ
jgi:hypothetical protein